MTSDPILTDDGSFTLRHPELGETYHARQGARSEALHKFIQPSRLNDRLRKGPVYLLDVGLGLGVNCAAALACATEHALSIDTVEREPEALDRGLSLDPDNALLLDLRHAGHHRTDTAEVHLHLGDLRRILPRLNRRYDLIFHDPFSPMKNTECWTVEIFHLMRERLHPDGVLVTYSESEMVRSGLREAGFLVGSTPAVPPHRGGTLAACSSEQLDHPLPAGTTLPFHDPDLHLTAHHIRSRREQIIRNQKLPSD